MAIRADGLGPRNYENNDSEPGFLIGADGHCDFTTVNINNSVINNSTINNTKIITSDIKVDMSPNKSVNDEYISKNIPILTKLY
jgi:hypothetical protein